MLKGDRATPCLILFSRVERSWKCKNILCGRECTVPLPDGQTNNSDCYLAAWPQSVKVCYSYKWHRWQRSYGNTSSQLSLAIHPQLIVVTICQNLNLGWRHTFPVKHRTSTCDRYAASAYEAMTLWQWWHNISWIIIITTITTTTNATTITTTSTKTVIIIITTITIIIISIITINSLIVSWQLACRWLSHQPSGRLSLLSTRPVWFLSTKPKTKMVKNEKITNLLTKTKTKTKKIWKLKRN